MSWYRQSKAVSHEFLPDIPGRIRRLRPIPESGTTRMKLPLAIDAEL